MPSRPTLASFRAQFPSEAMGICQADPQVATYCNQAQDELIIDPLAPDEGWWGGWATMHLTASIINNSAYVVTPREIARLIVMGVCDKPIHIRNGFYEYLNFGSGLQPKHCCHTNCGQTFQAFERDNAVTFSPLLPGGQTVRIYPTDSRDAGLRVLFQGTDQNNQTILTTDPGTGTSAPGEYISLAFPFVNSANTYNGITGIQKDQLYGPIQLFQVNPTTGSEAPLSTMDPNESSANYRRYLVTGIPNSNLCCYSPAEPLRIRAQARLDFIPVENETDYLTIQCIPALLEQAQAIRYRRMDNGAQQSMFHHQQAIALLNGQLDLYCGKTSTAVKIPIFGSNRMHRQLV